MKREINIPKFLHEIHGRRATLFSLILVYFNALAVSFVSAYFILPVDFPVWKETLFVVLMLDIAGGVIANFTNSTNQYYQENNKLRISFILMHLVQPILLIVIFPTEKSLFIFMGLYAIVSCLILNFIRGRETQRLIAAFLFSTGLIISFAIPSEIDLLRIIPLLFFLKLILGFSVRHSTNI